MNIIIFGPMNSGKGTIASRLSLKLEIPHISTGDLLREEIRQGTEIGKSAEAFVKKGLLNPDNVVTDLLKKRLSQKDAKKGFILEGYPRNMSQALILDKIAKIDAAVILNVPEWILLSRAANRVTCRKCGAIYNLLSVKPKKEGICDKDGGELYHREDDNEASIKNRLEIYNKDTKPLIDYYKQKGILKEFFCDKLDTPPEDNAAQVLRLLGVNK
ncbi:MAG: nucleoside monophosphate kinase [Candidatus Micrarchaeales archaeon]